MPKSSFFIYLSKRIGLFYIVWAFTFLLISSSAQATIAVSDYHLELIVKELIGDRSPVIFPFQSKGDPHHYEPNVQAIKKYLSADLFIINLSGDSWKNNLSQKISSNKKSDQYLDLELENDFPDLIKKYSSHSLSHFWLVPQVGCHYYKKIKNFLNSKNINTKSQDCPYSIIKQIKSLSKNHPWHTIILTHDATEYFFNQIEQKNLIILKSSHHGDRIKANDLKKVYQVTSSDQKKPILWLLESQVETPTRLKRRMRSFDDSLSINTLGDQIKSSQDILNQLQNQVVDLAKKKKSLSQ